MKQQIPKPVAIAIIIIAVVAIVFLGWKLINPPEPKPVGLPPGQQMMPPAMPPVAPPAPGQQPQGAPQAPATGGQQTEPM